MMNKILIILLLLISNIGLSQNYIREYWYNASDNDSKIDARNSALLELKKQVIEEVGTLVSTQTDMINDNGEKNIRLKTKVISESITKTEIIDESWDGYVYYVKAKIYIDEKDVIKRLKKINFNYTDQYETPQRNNINNNNNINKSSLNKNNEKYSASFLIEYQPNLDYIFTGISFSVISYDMLSIGLYGRAEMSNISENNYIDYGFLFGLNSGINKNISIGIPIKMGTGSAFLDDYKYNFVIINPSIELNIKMDDNKINTSYLTMGLGYKYINKLEYDDVDFLNGLNVYLKFKIIK